jgi:hypothetical protein
MEHVPEFRNVNPLCFLPIPKRKRRADEQKGVGMFAVLLGNS